jgi:hypothetical protein
LYLNEFELTYYLCYFGYFTKSFQNCAIAEVEKEMDFYLKYFHGSNKSVDKKLMEIESEMKLQESGQYDDKHIDDLRMADKYFF